MSQHKVSQYSTLPADAQIGHDIRAGLKQLRAVATVRVVTTTHGQDPQEDVHPADLHQAFRYDTRLIGLIGWDNLRFCQKRRRHH
jgi:hypothetical protein